LLDFPGRVAALVFTGGCNLTCPFCHNGELVLSPEIYPDFPVADLLADLDKRKGFIDGVVVSGGEPTLDAGLPAFLTQLKDRGLQVKLDSNGLRPNVIEALLEAELVDYYAVDIKTSLARYQELHTHPVAVDGLQRTISLLKDAAIEVEFRTTCIPDLVEAAEIDAMGALLDGAPLWVLQQFVPSHAMNAAWRERQGHSPVTLETFARMAEKYVKQVQIRGL
jgi:pyruvate formate lyase activating enzyme